MTKIGVIGCGYWGPNYIRIFNELDENSVQFCCDLEEANLSKIKKLYPEIKLVKNHKLIAENPDIDAVVITTPLRSHYEIAKLFLQNKKHVLVEKPLCCSSRQARELRNLAQRNSRILMVGHVYKYNPGIQKLKEYIAKKQLGHIYYVSAERLGLGPIRKYADALWDLATHDISIALYLLNEYPEKVTAVGEYYIQENIKDLVFISLQFPSRIIYNIYVSWFAPEKIRKTSVIGSKSMAVFDDVNKSEVLKIYKREVDKKLLYSTPEYSDHQLVVNVGDIYIPKIEQSEPLKNQIIHFLECISKNKNPLSDADDGINVVRILEAAEESLKSKRTVKCR